MSRDEALRLALDDARMHERARIVAWLRGRAFRYWGGEDVVSECMHGALTDAACLIERWEHER